MSFAAVDAQADGHQDAKAIQVLKDMAAYRASLDEVALHSVGRERAAGEPRASHGRATGAAGRSEIFAAAKTKTRGVPSHCLTGDLYFRAEYAPDLPAHEPLPARTAVY